MSRPLGFSSFNRTKTIAGLTGLAFVLCGCVGGPDTKSILTPVPSDLITGSIPTPAPTSDDGSDGQVASAAVGALSHLSRETGEIPWANPATGTTGVISQVGETDVAGRRCRAFETSRHSYSGIDLYYGKTCLGPDGQWRMIEFQPKEPMDATATATTDPRTSQDG